MEEEMPQEEEILPGPPPSPPPSAKSLAEGISAVKEEVPQEDVMLSGFEPASVEKLKKQLRSVRRLQKRYKPHATALKAQRTGPPPPFPPPPVAYDLTKPPGLPLSVVMQTPPPPATPPPEFYMDDQAEAEAEVEAALEGKGEGELSEAEVDAELTPDKDELVAFSAREKDDENVIGSKVAVKVEPAPKEQEKYVYNYDDTVMTVKATQAKQQAESIQEQYAKYQPKVEAEPAEAEPSVPLSSKLPTYNVDETVVNVAAGASIVASNEVERKVAEYETPLRSVEATSAQEPVQTTATTEQAKRKSPGFDEADTVMTVERGYTRNAFEEVVSSYQSVQTQGVDIGGGNAEGEEQMDEEVASLALDDSIVTIQKGFSKVSMEEVVKRYTPPPQPIVQEKVDKKEVTAEKDVEDEANTDDQAFDYDKTVMTIQKDFSKGEMENVLKSYKPDQKQDTSETVEEEVGGVKDGEELPGIPLTDAETQTDPPRRKSESSAAEVEEEQVKSKQVPVGVDIEEEKPLQREIQEVGTVSDESEDSVVAELDDASRRDELEADKVMTESVSEAESQPTKGESTDGDQEEVEEASADKEKQLPEGEGTEQIRGHNAETAEAEAGEGTGGADEEGGTEDREPPQVGAEFSANERQLTENLEGRRRTSLAKKSSEELQDDEDADGEVTTAEETGPTMYRRSATESDMSESAEAVQAEMSESGSRQLADDSANLSAAGDDETSSSAYPQEGSEGSRSDRRRSSATSGFMGEEAVVETIQTVDRRGSDIGGRSSTASDLPKSDASDGEIEGLKVDADPTVDMPSESREVASVSGKASTASGSSSAPGVYFKYEDTVVNVQQRSVAATKDDQEEASGVTARFNYEDTVMKIEPKPKKSPEKPFEEPSVHFDYENTVMKVDKALAQQAKVEEDMETPRSNTSKVEGAMVGGESVRDRQRAGEDGDLEQAADDEQLETAEDASFPEQGGEPVEGLDVSKEDAPLASPATEETSHEKGPEEEEESKPKAKVEATSSSIKPTLTKRSQPLQTRPPSFHPEVSDVESVESSTLRGTQMSAATSDVREMYRTDSAGVNASQQRRVKRVSFSEEEASTIPSRRDSTNGSGSIGSPEIPAFSEVAEGEVHQSQERAESQGRKASTSGSLSSKSIEDNAPLAHETEESTSGERSEGGSSGIGATVKKSSSSEENLPASELDEEVSASGEAVSRDLGNVRAGRKGSASSGIAEHEEDYGGSSSLHFSDTHSQSTMPASSQSSAHTSSEVAGHSPSASASASPIAVSSSPSLESGPKESQSHASQAPPILTLPPSSNAESIGDASLPPPTSPTSSAPSIPLQETGFTLVSTPEPDVDRAMPLDSTIGSQPPLSSSSSGSPTTSTSESEEIYGPPPAVPPPPTSPPPPSTKPPGSADITPPSKPPPGYFTYNYPPQLEEQERLRQRMRQALQERNRAMLLERSAEQEEESKALSIDGLKVSEELHFVLVNVLRREWSERIEVQQYYSTTVRKLRHELETSDRTYSGTVSLQVFRQSLHKCLGFKQRDVNRILCFLGTSQGQVNYPPLLRALEAFAAELMDGALVSAKPPLVAGKQDPCVVAYVSLKKTHTTAKLRQFSRWINGFKDFRDTKVDLGVLLEGISEGALLVKLVTCLERRRNRHFRFRENPSSVIERIEMVLRHLGLQAPRAEQLFRGELKPVLSLLGHLLGVYVFQKVRHFQKVFSWYNEVLTCYGKDVPLQLMREPHRGLWASFGGGDRLLCVLHYYLGTAVVDLSSVYENPTSATDIKSNWYKLSRLLLKCGLPVPLTIREVLAAELENQDMLLLVLISVRNRFKSVASALPPSSFRTILSPTTKQRKRQVINVYFKGGDKVFSSSRDYLSDSDIRKHQLRRKYIARKLQLGDAEEHKEEYTDCLSIGDTASLASEDIRDIEQELSSYFKAKHRFAVSLDGSLEPCDLLVENVESGLTLSWEHALDIDRKGCVALEDIAMCEMCTESTESGAGYILVQFQHGHFSAIQSSGGYKEMCVYASYDPGDEAFGLQASKEADLLRLFANLLKLLDNHTVLTLTL